MTIPKRLEAKLEKFLARKAESNGGWADLNQQDMQLLNDFLWALREAKCEKDADGDIPLEFTLVNRRETESFHYSPTRYTHKVKDDAIFDEFRTRMTNLQIASSSVDQIAQEIQYRKKNLVKSQKETPDE